ncbi:MAG: 2-amino-4-hydroxy-6-hydroxymethyldihydropteridine diphosphokinase [Hyphomicrobiaceae bacterium]|jgi:2-amino-4-hydroxy-6-hydroxymethyldihydropteridine diphosphokinase|nr:2-amino-4-hydroxy-6-hydroxymethyldihydropteridine diphosphokinase [Hyphomicrobiaceae bacterium]
METDARANFDAVISIGSNIGDKAGNIARAISLLTAGGSIQLAARSSDYRTPPWGNTEQDWFVNACITVRTTLSAHDVLARCQAVESELKRVREVHWGPRVIDLDVIWFRGESIDEPDLIVPHPRTLERAFVLVPLAEIAPDLVIAGRTVSAHLSRIERTGVEPYGE